ncbi:MAG: PadR family transcriptional regulator [Beijerinckiaceae bacterium]
MTAEMLKGHLDAIILSALDAGEAHGYAIIETIRQQSEGTFDLAEGTVYPALHRLELAGLLESQWTMPEAGRRRRMYSLTPSGRASLATRRKNWLDFSRAINGFLGQAVPCPT